VLHGSSHDLGAAGSSASHTGRVTQGSHTGQSHRAVTQGQPSDVGVWFMGSNDRVPIKLLTPVTRFLWIVRPAAVDTSR